LIDWHSILLKYGVSVENTEEVMIKCPFHEDRRESCALNLEKGVWICFAGCGQGGLKGFIKEYSGKSWDEINADIQEEELDLNWDFLDELVVEEEPPVYEEPEGLEDMPNNHWIYERGFNKSTINQWDCRTNKYLDFMIPVKNIDNEVLGWIARRRNAIPKYMYSKGFAKAKTLFGINQILDTNKIYLVEGALDCMWLNQHGYSSLAILGASISRKQVELISSLRPSEVVLSLDNDAAGQKGIDKATVDMNNRFLLSYLRLPKNYKDVQEIRNIDTLHKVIKNTTIF
jgi:DNA primase